MEAEEINENHVLTCTEDFLSAEALVGLRKPAEDSNRLVVGEKFYRQTNSLIERKAVEDALAHFKETLDKKRAGRVCDLMQAEWNEELNVSLTDKLKGKYVQHMGRNVNGKIALSPEESMFLLENGCIEIKNGETIMSSVESSAMMLKGNLGTEKYQVYSHLAQLGFIVVPHQTKLGVTRYEQQINLDKHKVRKRKNMSVAAEAPSKKRLTFTGALSGEPQQSISHENSENQLVKDGVMECSTFTDAKENEIKVDTEVCKVINDGASTEVNKSASDLSNLEDLSNQHINSILTGEADPTESQNNEIGEPDSIEEIGTVGQVLNIDKESLRDGNTNSLDILECDNEVEVEQNVKQDVATVEIKGQNNGDNSVSCSVSQPALDSDVEKQQQVVVSHSDTAAISERDEIDVMDVFSVSCSVLQPTLDSDKEKKQQVVDSHSDTAAISEKDEIDVMDVSSVSCSVLQPTLNSDMEKQQKVVASHSDTAANSEKDEIDVMDVSSVSCSVLQPTLDSDMEKQQQVADHRSDTAATSEKEEIDVMDVDSQNTEISCNVSDTSREAFDQDRNNSTNAASQDSSCAVVDSSVGNVYDNEESNSDIMSCSSSSNSESDVLSLEADSMDSFERNEHGDDDITLIEITKKETTPLAIIDLLSEEERQDSEHESFESDDEISVVKICSAPSGSKDTHMGGSVNYRKLGGCKKEEASSPVKNPKFTTSALKVKFPALKRKDFVCVPRPPLNLLPNFVKPAKEAYVLDLKSSNEHMSNRRVWNSYRQMQDYQHARHGNRHMNHSFSEFQEQNQRGHPGGIPRPHGNPFPPNGPSGLVNGQTGGLDGRPGNYGHPRDFDRTPLSYPNTYPLPNSSLMNSVVSIRQQNMSMVGNPSFPPLAPGFLPNLPLPNVMPGMGPAQLMSEVQRTAYSVARSMLSYMLNPQQNGNSNHPPMPPFNLHPNINGHSSAMSPHPFPHNSPNFQPDFSNGNMPSHMFNDRMAYRSRRRHTGRPFPCHFRGATGKKNWDEVRSVLRSQGKDWTSDNNSAIGNNSVICNNSVIGNNSSRGNNSARSNNSASSNNSVIGYNSARGNDSTRDNNSASDSSDIEEVPITPTEILWDPAAVNPLMKPGIRHVTSLVINSLVLIRWANLMKCSLNDRYFLECSCLEVSFDVYLPGYNYRKTSPGIPKHRIIVVKATDPLSRYSDLVRIQLKWNDGALLQVAVVDNGDVSFMSFNDIYLPTMIPHVE